MSLDMEEMRAKLKERIDQINSSPSLDELIESGEIVKHRGGYEVRSERALNAISPHIKSMMSPNDKSKPMLFTLYTKVINQCKIKI